MVKVSFYYLRIFPPFLVYEGSNYFASSSANTKFFYLTQTYQSLCKSSVDFNLSYDAFHARPAVMGFYFSDEMFLSVNIAVIY